MKDSRINVLITGASGRLGSSIFTEFEQSAIGTCFSQPKNNFIQLDIKDRFQVDDLFAKYKFRTCIHCAANPDVGACQKDPDGAYKLNVLATQNITKACEKYKVRLVHISTDYVFDGTANTPYQESSVVNPLQVYGVTKLQAENAVLEYANSLVVRVSFLYWRESNYGRLSLPVQIIKKLTENQPITLDCVETRQPAFVEDIAKAIKFLSGLELTGIIHCAPTETTTKYDWGLWIAKKYGLDFKLISKSDYPIPGPSRPKYTVLNIDKWRSLKHLNLRGFEEGTLECLG